MKKLIDLKNVSKSYRNGDQELQVLKDVHLEVEEGYNFVFQISSDDVAQYNVVDSGSLMFFYNENEDKWMMYFDFY